MAEARPSGVSDHRRWAFAGCVFDEANWTLTVDGVRVPVESKPLKLLRELLLRPGEVVSKETLLDAVWPEVTVVEASLTTAVRKLRMALGDDRGDRRMIETVSAIGYRFAAPVELSGTGPASVPSPHSEKGRSASVLTGARRPLAQGFGLVSNAAAVGIVAIAAVLGLSLLPRLSPSKAAPTFTSREVVNAIRKLDVEEAERLIAAGWNPDVPFDAQGDTALGFAVEICEWDPGHDRRRLMLMARTLLDGGATLDHRNIFGDTAYSIAKAKRFCGPDHPVTEMFRRICNSGRTPLRDRCMASYELARGQHFDPPSRPES